MAQPSWANRLAHAALANKVARSHACVGKISRIDRGGEAGMQADKWANRLGGLKAFMPITPHQSPRQYSGQEVPIRKLVRGVCCRCVHDLPRAAIAPWLGSRHCKVPPCWPPYFPLAEVVVFSAGWCCSRLFHSASFWDVLSSASVVCDACVGRA